MIKPTKVNLPKEVKDLSTTDTSDDETEDNNAMEDIIVELPGNQHGHEDNVEEENSRDEITEEDVGTASEYISDDPHTPRRLHDRYSPANYNCYFYKYEITGLIVCSAVV